MPELSVSEAQRERFEEIRAELETVYVGEYGTVTQHDAFQYLLDTYTPPDAEDESDLSSEIERLTAINGVGEATAEAMIAAGFPTVEHVGNADPDALAEIKGISREQATDITDAADTLKSDEGGESDDDTNEGTERSASDSSDDTDSPEDTLQQAMSLLDAHDDRWRESNGDEPYEVDLPDGSTEAVRTKDDIKRLIFKHWR